MKFATRVGLKVVDFWYLLNKPSLKRDLLYFDALAVDTRHLEQCTRFAELLCVLYQKDAAPILGPCQRDLEVLSTVGLLEDLSARRPHRGARQEHSEIQVLRGGEALFGMTRTDLGLLEAEASAPGREVAYLERAEAAFGQH